jgi:hypothetical protein
MADARDELIQQRNQNGKRLPMSPGEASGPASSSGVLQEGPAAKAPKTLPHDTEEVRQLRKQLAAAELAKLEAEAAEAYAKASEKNTSAVLMKRSLELEAAQEKRDALVRNELVNAVLYHLALLMTVTVEWQPNKQLPSLEGHRAPAIRNVRYTRSRSVYT